MGIEQKIQQFGICFDSSPLAFSVLKAETDSLGNVVDFRFIYANKTLSVLEDIPLDKICGMLFSEIFSTTAMNWIQFYKDIAINGKSDSTIALTRNTHKYLNVQSYQLEKGYAACFLMDISNEVLLKQQYQAEKEKYQTLLNTTPGGIAVFELFEGKSKLLFFNNEICKITGYTAAEIEAGGEYCVCSAIKEDRKDVDEKFYDLKGNNGTVSVEYSIRTKRGALKCISLRSSVVCLGDKIKRVYSIYTDITRQKKIQQELYEKEMLYKIATENTDVNIWELDLKNKILYNTESSKNKHYADSMLIFDFPESILATDTVKEESKPVLRELIEKLYRGEENVTRDLWYNKPNGETWCERVTYINVFNEKREPVKAIGVGKNITNEYELQVEKKITDMALESANIIIWQYDIKNKSTKLSPRTASEFGISKNINNMPEGAIDLGVIAEESKTAYRDMYELINRGAKEAAAEICYILPGNKKAWKHCILTAIQDDDGKNVMAVGSGIDVSEKKLSEKKFIEEYTLQNELVIDKVIAKARVNITNNTMEYFFAEEDLNMAWYNDNYDKTITEFSNSLENLEQKAMATEKLTRNKIIERLNNGEKTFTFEYQTRLKSGEVVWLSNNGKVLKNPITGEIICFIYTQNITKQKNTELLIEKIIDYDYDFWATIDIKSEKLSFYGKNRNYYTGSNYTGCNYTYMYENTLRQIVANGQVEESVRAMKIETIINELASQEAYVCSFPIEKDGKILYKQWCFRYLDKEKSTIMFTRFDITEAYKNNLIKHISQRF